MFADMVHFQLCKFDKEQNIWIDDSNNGILKLSPKEHFSHIYQTIDTVDSSLLDAKGNMWLHDCVLSVCANMLAILHLMWCANQEKT